VVSLPFTQHLIPRWSGCATAAYAKERKESATLSDIQKHCVKVTNKHYQKKPRYTLELHSERIFSKVT